MAREFASEKCVRCSRLPDRKTAAVLYGGSRWDYCYCYQCRRWFVRDPKYRYATASMDESDAIGRLMAQLQLQRETTDAQLEGFAWLRKSVSAACRFLRGRR